MTISGNRNNEGAGRPLPEGGAARYAVLLATNFWKLAGLNLLFVTFSLPVMATVSSGRILLRSLSAALSGACFLHCCFCSWFSLVTMP